MSSRETIGRLGALRGTFGRRAARGKLRLIRRLERTTIRDAADLRALHEILLFIRAYPDRPEVLRAAQAALEAFPRRVRRLAAGDPREADALDNTGIAGTCLASSFSWDVARRLAATYPRAVSMTADEAETEDRFAEALPGLLLPAEAEAVADGYIRPRRWLKASSPRSAEAKRLLRLFAGEMPGAAAGLWGAMGFTVEWDLGTSGGSRSLARAPSWSPAFLSRRPARRRPDLRAEAARPGPPLRNVAEREGEAWCRLAFAAVTSRFREMHTLVHASAADVVVAEPEPGLSVAMLGVRPEARHPLRAFVGWLLVRNGVPVGYGDVLALFEWGELNFHVFDTFRQAESAMLYAAVVRAVHRHLGVAYLHLNPYQFGHHNEEAIATGTFWFYEKLGFRPRARAQRRLWLAERRALSLDRAHRTPPGVLRALAGAPMGLAIAGPPRSVERRWHRFHPAHLALSVSRRIERRFGGDRILASRHAFERLCDLLGGSWDGARGEALRKLAPALDLIPDLERWTAAERRLLTAVICAKAEGSERDYLLATRRHSRLRAAWLRAGSSALR